MEKHAYCFVANSNFYVLETALKMIDDPRNDIYVLFDEKAHVACEYVSSLSNILHFSELKTFHKLVNWGGYSQVDAVLHLLESCIVSKADYSYIHFMQGSDLPVKDQDSIHQFFQQHKGIQFVEVDRGRMNMASWKCHYKHFFCHNRFFRKNKLVKLCNFSIAWFQKTFRIKQNKDITLYHGSALFSITSDCAKYILSRSQEIHRRFRFALAPDEVFLQTMLMDSPYMEKIADIEDTVSCNARLIDRTRPDGKNSPHIWRKEEIAVILSQPDSICFARKFDASIDSEIIRLLFNEIEGKHA